MTKNQFRQALKELEENLGLDLADIPIPEDPSIDYEILLKTTKAIFTGEILNFEEAASNLIKAKISTSSDTESNEFEELEEPSKYDNLTALANTAILGALEANYYKLLEDPLFFKPEQIVALAKLQSTVSEA